MREETVPTRETEDTNCLKVNGIAQSCLRGCQIVDRVRSRQSRQKRRFGGGGGATEKAKRDKQCQAHLCEEQKTVILLALIGRLVLLLTRGLRKGELLAPDLEEFGIEGLSANCRFFGRLRFRLSLNRVRSGWFTDWTARNFGVWSSQFRRVSQNHRTDQELALLLQNPARDLLERHWRHGFLDLSVFRGRPGTGRLEEVI